MAAIEEKEVGMELDQIQQLYLLYCHRNDEEPIYKREDAEEQLDYIKTEMEKLTAAIELAHEMMELETRSDIAEHGSGKSHIPRKWSGCGRIYRFIIAKSSRDSFTLLSHKGNIIKTNLKQLTTHQT